MERDEIHPYYITVYVLHKIMYVHKVLKQYIKGTFCCLCSSMHFHLFLQFNTRVNNTACFDHLVQANVRNKKILKDGVQNITAKGITNYTKGFEFAFKQLSDVSIYLMFTVLLVLLGTCVRVCV